MQTITCASNSYIQKLLSSPAVSRFSKSQRIRMGLYLLSKLTEDEAMRVSLDVTMEMSKHQTDEKIAALFEKR